MIKKIKRNYKEATALKEINRNSGVIRSLEWDYISMKDEYNEFTSLTIWENIEPETADDALLEEVCTQPKKYKEKVKKGTSLRASCGILRACGCLLVLPKPKF